jgi:hypothetical protein
MTGARERISMSLKVVARTLIPLIIAAFVFFLVTGGTIIVPTNIAWLQHGDLAQDYVGWEFFRKSAWSLPIGLNPNYGLEIGTSILFSDSLPLFAFLFKLASRWLPNPFQYDGLWVFSCFLLQAWFAWKIVRSMSEDILACISAVGLFLFAPPLLMRVCCHIPLVGQWVILASLYLYFVEPKRGKHIWWPSLIFVTILVHPYLLVMVLGLWVADLWKRLLIGKGGMRGLAREIVFVSALGVLGLWTVGYFQFGEAGSSGSFGLFRMNLLSPIDPGFEEALGWHSDWSYLLKDLPGGPGDYEGFNYLGLGLLIGIVLGLAVVIHRFPGIGEKRKWIPLLIILLGFTLFSLSNNIGIGAKEISFSAPAWVLEYAGVFRASGRMFWPVFYAICCAVIWILIRGYRGRWAATILSAMVLIQVVDTSAGWRPIRHFLSRKVGSTWDTPLKSDFWRLAGSSYKKVRRLMPGNIKKDWEVFAHYAATHNMATDSVYFARVNSDEVNRAIERARVDIATGNFAGDSLYILDEAVVRQVLLSPDTGSVRNSSALVAKVDGFYVLAPGWKESKVGTAAVKGLKLDDLFAHPATNGVLSMGRGGNGLRYLVTGWSQPEESGTWSDGREAELLVPVQAQRGDDVVLTFHASGLFGKGGTQVVEVWINRLKTGAITFDERHPNGRYSFAVPKAALKEGDTQNLQVLLRIQSPVKPKDLGINNDIRDLGIHLAALEVSAHRKH